MKLIGSLQEKQFRAELSSSNHFLFHEETGARLLAFLKKNFGQLKTAYILQWIPEQGEDLYTVLINDDIIADVEVPHVDSTEESKVLGTTTAAEYAKCLRKFGQIKLAVALDLARADLAQ